jgi:glutathionylspermidine synthase
MEANRFKKANTFKKKDLPPQVSWYADKEYLVEDMLGLYASEVNYLDYLSKEGFKLMCLATDKIIQENNLTYLGIPSFFHECVANSWLNKNENPFLFGRFDFGGGLDGMLTKVIEFNADTCTMLPETIHWQKQQLGQLPVVREQINRLKEEITGKLSVVRKNINFDQANFLASSFGYQEDVINCNSVIESAIAADFNVFYTDLKNVEFSAEDGIFYESGRGEFQPVDVWFKIIPWDWMFTEEPELAKTIAAILEKKLCVILNPVYTTIWQNKKFLAYINENFSNNIFAETVISSPSFTALVEKPIYGRIGENINLFAEKTIKTGGDYGKQEKIFQQYYPLPKDAKGNYYQLGMFFSESPCAVNCRFQDSPIIGEDSEFISHFIM